MSETLIPRAGNGATVTSEIPIIEVDDHAGHTLEPEWKRLPIGPDHILYPVLVGLALFPILMGASGHHLADAEGTQHELGRALQHPDHRA